MIKKGFNLNNKNKSKNINKLFLFIICSAVFIFIAHTTSAMEVTLPGLVSNPTLPQYVAYFFTLGVSLSGFLCAVSFAVGAIEFTMSGGSPGTATEAKDRMKASVIGLVITVAAVLIITTINSSIATPTTIEIPIAGINNPTAGVYFTDNKTYIQAPPSVSSSDMPSGLNNIKYICGTSASSTGPNVIVWQYANTDFTSLQQTSTLTCGDSTTINAGSLKWDYERPGIYLCSEGCNSDGTCKGLISPLISTDQNTIPPEFNVPYVKDYIECYSTIPGVRFVNDPTNNIYYGAIFSSTNSFDVSAYEASGKCSFPVVSKFSATDCETTDIKNNPLNYSSSSVAVFTIGNNATSKLGVNFYSNPNGWVTNIQGKLTSGVYNGKTAVCSSGSCMAADGTCSSEACTGSSPTNQIVEINPSQMCYNYTNSVVPISNQYKCGVNHNNSCGIANKTNCSATSLETVQDGIGSLQIDSTERYLVALYSGTNFPTYNSMTGVTTPVIQYNLYCQIFRNTASNFNALTFPQYFSPITDVYLIRTK